MVSLALRTGGKRINELRVYLYFNARSNGYFDRSTQVIEQAAADLGVSTKTIKRKLDQLCKWNWMGFDGKCKRYYIRGFRTIKKLEGEFSRQGFLLDARTDLKDFRRFKAFIAGAFINNLSRYGVYRKEKKQRDRAGEWLKGRSNQGARSRMFRWHPVAAPYIAVILGVSIDTAHNYRKLAADKEYEFIELKVRRTAHSLDEVRTLEASDKEKDNKLFARMIRQNGRYLTDDPHWVRSTVIHYRRIPRTKKLRRRNKSKVTLSLNTPSSYSSTYKDSTGLLPEVDTGNPFG